MTLKTFESFFWNIFFEILIIWKALIYNNSK